MKKPIARARGLASKVAEDRSRLDAIAKVAEGMANWRPAKAELREVRAVPTIFPQVDRITRVGGWPIDRFALVHGPSSDGKTVFVHGLGLSFLRGDHFYGYVDAEHTTPVSWVHKLLGDFASHPGFRAARPTTYEATVDASRSFCESIGNAKEHGALPPDTTGLLVIDSIRKLVPKKLLDKLMKEGSDAAAVDAKGRKKRGAPAGVDGFGGRAAQIKAALNAAWLDELVPLLAQTGTAAIFIARETDDMEAGPFSRRDFKIGGGKALVYDSSLQVRIVKEGTVRDATGGPVVGERHMVEIWKTKVSARTDAIPTGAFHTSNGVLVAEGFDRARDVLDLALDVGMFTMAGSHVRWGKIEVGHGLGAAVVKLTDDPILLDRVEQELRERDDFVDRTVVPAKAKEAP